MHHERDPDPYLSISHCRIIDLCDGNCGRQLWGIGQRGNCSTSANLWKSTKYSWTHLLLQENVHIIQAKGHSNALRLKSIVSAENNRNCRAHRKYRAVSKGWARKSYVRPMLIYGSFQRGYGPEASFAQPLCCPLCSHRRQSPRYSPSFIKSSCGTLLQFPGVTVVCRWNQHASPVGWKSLKKPLSSPGSEHPAHQPSFIKLLAYHSLGLSSPGTWQTLAHPQYPIAFRNYLFPI